MPVWTTRPRASPISTRRWPAPPSTPSSWCWYTPRTTSIEIAGRFDLALAGHTHGGQLVVPGLAPFWLPPGGKRYVRGWYSRNGSQLFVSRGIGTSIIPARLFARPELAIIEVHPR